MDKREVLARIESGRVIPVIRTDSKEKAAEIAEAIIEGGLNCLEITMTVPDAVQLVGELSRKYRKVIVGAGTVLDEGVAKDCIAADAKFIVTPYLNLEVIDVCNQAGILSCVGALTPTEIFTAWRAGADVIKVFPIAAMGGAAYLKALKAPFPDIKLLPTGGISIDNFHEFLEAGAIAVGVGGEISNWDLLKSKGKSEITERFVSLIGARNEDRK